MQTLLLLASRTKGSTLELYLAIGVAVLFAVLIIALVRKQLNLSAAWRERWKEAVEALGFEDLTGANRLVMKGMLHGREVSLGHKPVQVSKYSSDHYLACQVTFSSPLGSEFSIEPWPIILWGLLGGDKTNIPAFDDKFKVVTAHIDYVTRVLTASPERVDGHALADEFLHRAQLGRRICVDQTTLELAIKQDFYESLTEPIKELGEETIELADLIERRARSIENDAIRVDEPEPFADPFSV